MFFLFAPAAQKRVAYGGGGGRLGSSVELFDPTFTPNPSSPPSPRMVGRKTPAPPPSPTPTRFGTGRALAPPPVNLGHRSVVRSASVSVGGPFGGAGSARAPPPSPSSHFAREMMDSAGSVSGNNRGSGGDIALRQLDAELGRGFIIGPTLQQIQLSSSLTPYLAISFALDDGTPNRTTSSRRGTPLLPLLSPASTA